MPQAERHVSLTAGDQVLDGIVAGGVTLLQDRESQLVKHPGDDRQHDRRSIGEMGVDRGSGDPDLAGDRAQRHRLVGPFALDELQSSRNDVLGQAAALTSSIALVPWQRIAALPFGSDLDDRLGLLILHGSYFTTVSSSIYTYNCKSTIVRSE